MASFSALDAAAQAAIQEKQRDKAARKQTAKEQAKKAAAASTATTAGSDDDGLGLDRFPTRISQDEYFDACPGGLFADPSLVASEASVDIIFDLMAQGVEMGRFRDGTKATLAHFSYFQFAGTDAQVWGATLYARLAHAGFFTITTTQPRPGKRADVAAPQLSSEPLAELQPCYSVVGWRQFEAAKQVQRTLKRLRGSLLAPRPVNAKDPAPQYSQAFASTATEGQPPLRLPPPLPPPPLPLPPRYRLKVASDGGAAVWRAVDRYQQARHRGNNWLTIRYLALMRRASADPTINFTLHAIELWETVDRPAAPSAAEAAVPGAAAAAALFVAGEIGYSVGAVYTSLSGFSLRTALEASRQSVTVGSSSSSGGGAGDLECSGGANVGTVQLVLLGR